MSALKTKGKMTAPIDQNQEQKSNDKELNFRALEAKYQRQLDQANAARMEAERIAQEAISKRNQNDDEDDDSEPYVDKKSSIRHWLNSVNNQNNRHNPI